MAVGRGKLKVVTTKPIWLWLPDHTSPTRAGEITHDGCHYSVCYSQEFVGSGLAMDPIALRLVSSINKSAHLPGVIDDAKPSGYGQDALNAAHGSKLGRDLTALELLEFGAGDGVGAIAVCENIALKQCHQAPPLTDLVAALESLKESAPASQALGILSKGIATSAGGERPKITVSDKGLQWLAKLQDRGDRDGMPALEYTAMTLASQLGIRTPAIRLETVGAKQVFMIQRFDRAGTIESTTRSLYASAHAVLRLAPDCVRGDPRRSYLNFASEIRRWGSIGAAPIEVIKEDIRELWKRMVINALVGNIDDHARNHGLIFKEGVWRLSPAFDITPVRMPQRDASPCPALAMAVDTNGSCEATPHKLLSSAVHFGIEIDEARQFLLWASDHIANHWEGILSKSLAPLTDHCDQAVTERIVCAAKGAFAMSEYIVQIPDAVNSAAASLLGRPSRSRRHMLN